jgi:hypothetical protein
LRESRSELQSIADQTTDRAAYLRLAETLAAFLSRLRASLHNLSRSSSLSIARAREGRAGLRKQTDPHLRRPATAPIPF